jgi:hypothetical protein
MKTQLESLQATGENYSETLQTLTDLAAHETELKAAASKLDAQLSRIPVGALSLPESDSKAFEPGPARLVRSRQDAQIKLDLLPGIRVRYQAEADGLRQQIRAGVRGLVKECRRKAAAQLQELQRKWEASTLADCGGDLDRARAAAGDVADRSEAQKWVEAFQYYNHDSESLADIALACGLAEKFERNEPCD